MPWLHIFSKKILKNFKFPISYSYEDLMAIPVEQLKRGTPDAISAQGLDYEATLTKRWSLSGQHGIALRGLFYGQVYPEQTDYNELTFNLNAGYSYYNERNQVLIAPVFEHKYYAHDPLYSAYGLRGEWMRFISNDKAVKLEAEMKDINYSQYKGQAGLEYSVYSTFWKILPKNWDVKRPKSNLEIF